jgi:hypothetical protein
VPPSTAHDVSAGTRLRDQRQRRAGDAGDRMAFPRERGCAISASVAPVTPATAHDVSAGTRRAVRGNALALAAARLGDAGDRS